MKYFAIISTENLVEQVITAPDGSEELKAHYESVFGKRCVETFRDGSQRKRFAGIGMTYSDTLDAFIYAKPFASWILNSETAAWEAPTSRPADTATQIYGWDESSASWQAVTRFDLSQADADLLATVLTVEEIEATKDQFSEDGRAQMGLV